MLFGIARATAGSSLQGISPAAISVVTRVWIPPAPAGRHRHGDENDRAHRGSGAVDDATKVAGAVRSPLAHLAGLVPRLVPYSVARMPRSPTSTALLYRPASCNDKGIR